MKESRPSVGAAELAIRALKVLEAMRWVPETETEAGTGHEDLTRSIELAGSCRHRKGGWRRGLGPRGSWETEMKWKKSR